MTPDGIAPIAPLHEQQLVSLLMNEIRRRLPETKTLIISDHWILSLQKPYTPVVNSGNWAEEGDEAWIPHD